MKLLLLLPIVFVSSLYPMITRENFDDTIKKEWSQFSCTVLREAKNAGINMKLGLAALLDTITEQGFDAILKNEKALEFANRLLWCIPSNADQYFGLQILQDLIWEDKSEILNIPVPLKSDNAVQKNIWLMRSNPYLTENCLDYIQGAILFQVYRASVKSKRIQLNKKYN